MLHLGSGQQGDVYKRQVLYNPIDISDIIQKSNVHINVPFSRDRINGTLICTFDFCIISEISIGLYKTIDLFLTARCV